MTNASATTYLSADNTHTQNKGLCDELIIRLEESYRLWFVVVCDLETS
jgi:hypothetical protein